MATIPSRRDVHGPRKHTSPPAAIKLINTETRHLEQFDATSHTPGYVVLSYCRQYGGKPLPDTETGLAAVHQPMPFPGLEKGCAEALHHGAQYAWIDTCCLVESTDEELAAVVNSKFHRYRESQGCLAYLDDLDTVDNTDIRLWESRWFTCPWTLQSLIASPDVVFYDRSWVSLGSKLALLEVLAKHTEIDIQVLEDCRFLPRVPVGTRLAWAARRSTRRDEDMAYPLLGIFGLDIPVTYGEGGKAFRRLQRKISRTIDDDSVFFWQSSSTQYCRSLWAESPKDFAHFLGPPATEPLAIQVAFQLDHLETRVHGVFVVHGGRPGHLFLDLSNQKAPSEPGIMGRGWKGRFFRLQPQRVLRFSELPEASLDEIARRIGSLHISLDFATGYPPVGQSSANCESDAPAWTASRNDACASKGLEGDASASNGPRHGASSPNASDRPNRAASAGPETARFGLFCYACSQGSSTLKHQQFVGRSNDGDSADLSLVVGPCGINR